MLKPRLVYHIKWQTVAVNTCRQPGSHIWVILIRERDDIKKKPIKRFVHLLLR